MSHDSEQHQRSALQHEAEHAAPGKKNSVLIYLVILFAAAFLLLLLSYFMQQRASREAYSDLQQSSNSAVQSLDNMLQENEDLKEQVADLQAQLEQRVKRGKGDLWAAFSQNSSVVAVSPPPDPEWPG